MSIPKEPRQLMINLMYLVLTALLALNVSAEIINAFFDIDKSIQKTNKLTAKSVGEVQKGIQPILDKKPKLRGPLNAGMDAVREEVAEFVSYMDGVRSGLIDACGDKNGTEDDGDYIMEEGVRGKPIGKKNKDATTRLLVDEGQGDEIQAKIDSLRSRLIGVYTETINKVSKEAGLKKSEVDAKIANISNNITLGTLTMEEIKKKAPDKKSWADYKFRQMPLAAVLPTLTKIQSDARGAEASIINEFAGLVGGREIKFDKFFPVINARQGYVIKGEKFDAKVSLGAYSSEIKGIKLSVNGQSINVNKEGVGSFSESANSLGKRTLNLKAVVTNPLTGETQTVTDKFEYEVGERSANVSADKMNVFYIGVDNPVSVSAGGINSNELKVSCSGGGCNLSKTGKFKYNAKATQPGQTATITLTGGGLPATRYEFRVKRIPDPAPILGRSKGGAMGTGEFKAQEGIRAVLENFDFDARCKIQGFEIARVPKRADPIIERNQGGRYSGKVGNMVRAAKPGDIYYFDNIKSRCPGDKAGRDIGSMVFRIK